MKNLFVLLLFGVFFLCGVYSLDPTREIQLYPNTQNSDSIYIFSFKLQKSIPSGSYILVNMDWYSSALLPFRCIMVNTSISLSCTNFGSPTFPLTITVAQLKQHNSKLDQNKTVAVLLNNNLVNNTQYNLQLHLFNIVPNIRKISPSAELYVVSKDGLVYEENINYGPAINRPPINTVLSTSILKDLSSNRPGELETFKAEFRISQPVETDLSAFTLVLHYPFSFSLGSLPRTYASELSATNPIPLYAKPEIAEYRIISPNIFYVVFSEKFITDRRFILEITQINNPFFLAQSNISIYSMNYNSLTPLEGLQHGYLIKTVSYPLTVALGLPFDQPQDGPRVFYKSLTQYVKVDITIPKAVPEGYAIRYVLTGGTIEPGTAFSNFQSLSIEPIYTYGSNFLIINGIGAILFGSKIETTLKIIKNPVTGFSFNVYIDTEPIIKTFTAVKYMYEGRVDGVTITKNGFLNNFYDSVLNTAWRISHNVVVSSYLVVTIYPQATEDTSTGAYLEIYLSPNFIVKDAFNQNTDCKFNGAANSAICTREKTASYLKLTIKSTTPLMTNPLPKLSYTTITIYNIAPERSSSNKFIFPCYFTLFKTDAPGATQYYDTRVITVMPQYNQLAKVRMEQYNQKYDQDFNYPGFLRVESTNSSEMNYITQENEVRVIMVVSRFGFKGMGSIDNQAAYPCASNINVKCTFLLGHSDTASLQQVLEWDRVVITFPSNEENTKKFHVLIPDTPKIFSSNFYYHFVGVYNKYTKDYKFYYMNDAFVRNSWGYQTEINTVLKSTLYVDFGGRAGSYRRNMTINIFNSVKNTGDFSFLCISTSWSFYQKGISSINPLSLALTNPTLGSNQSEPVSVYMSQGMYLTAIPILYNTNGSANNQFSIMLDNVHMPYEYDLPNYYIYFISSGNTPNGNQMSSSNQFLMTNAGIFYECPLKALTISCLNNALGVKNTICTIVFGTQNPLKADGKIRLVFSGMTIATNVCNFYNGATLIPSTCSSTADNKNLTVSLSGWEHYPAGNFTLVISGVGINASEISQSFTLYLYDSTAKYIIERGNRILTTTIAKQKVIEVYEILYSYNSPLSYNKMSIKFYLPRQIYSDQEFGFIMGKDLSDVNTQIKRLNIKLTKADGTQLSFLYRLISTEYKVMFSFDDPSQLTESNYTLEIYGVRTPASHQNGDFNIIFQRKFDKQYTLINELSTPFPTLRNYIISDVSIVSYFNTEGYDQQIDLTIRNRALPVNDKMIWVVNFPSYYSPLIFNYEPYCLIEGSPIKCSADPNTQYQLIIEKSPRIIAAGISYKISILGVACPRAQYMNNTFPNRYIFIGILQNSLAQYYDETSLLYPEQNVYNGIEGIIGVTNIQVASTNLTSFYNTYMTLVLKCNVAISAGQYLYLVFPPEFDNFNNKPLNAILKTTYVLGTLSAPVLDRRVEILIPSNIALNTQLRVEMTNVPTPTYQTTSQMSKIIAFVTLADKSKIRAASATSGNSAPKLTFRKDTRYISFNNDQEIVITAGTYSQMIDIKSSDGYPFRTNVKIALSSTGFVFQPADVLLKLGDDKAQFRIGADKDLFPVSYFYTAIKQQQVQTFYKITTNNNIRITNTPITITVPSSIDLPKGGCSEPILIKLLNPPMVDMSITFNYDNSIYNQNVFYPNPRTTKSSLPFTKTRDNNTFSMCTAENVTGSQIKVKLILTGTNYNSYKFAPFDEIVFNLVTLTNVQSPTVGIELINQQKTFVDFNITVNVNGILYYQLYIGDSSGNAMTSEAIQIAIKNQVSNLESMSDLLTTLYLEDRDQRVGQVAYNAGKYTLRLKNMLPQTNYVFCTYFENGLKVIKGPFCKLISTQNWGDMKVMSVKFTKTVSDFELNKAICFLTKFVSSKANYVADIEGNSCYDNAVKNINFKYSSVTFTEQKRSTNIYLATNPELTSDPSPISFDNMFNVTNNQLSSTVLAAALSGYGIDFMSGMFLRTVDARQTSSRDWAEKIQVSFSKPIFNANTNKIVISDVSLYGVPSHGTVYFLLVLYKQFVTDAANGYTSVKIRLNTDPSPWQVTNCKNWRNETAEGCARAVFSGTAMTVEFGGIQPDSMYLLYYLAANQYPFRPVVAYTVNRDSIVTMSWEFALVTKGLVGILVIFGLLI